MRILCILCILCTFQITLAQKPNEKEISSQIKEVTVFLKNAQITREKTFEIPAGKTTLKFIQLSPFIDAKSIQVKAKGDLTVLGVHHQHNYLRKKSKEKELAALEQDLEKITNKINLENTYLEVIKEEIHFLQSNRSIGGEEQISVQNLKEAASFFSSKLTDLKIKQLERNKTLKNLIQNQKELQQQMQSLFTKKEHPMGEILLTVKSKQPTKTKLTLSYIVKNASWHPSYDIRAKNINEPIEVVYKANIKQDTKVDWNNVALKLSSANPNLSGVAPVLKTYFLNYNVLPPSYAHKPKTVSGIITDGKDPLPGVNIIVKGTTIGTQTDFDGKYSLTIPKDASQLQISYLGMKSEVVPIHSDVLNINMEEDMTALEEVVVTGGSKRNRNDTVNERESFNIRGAASIPMPLQQVVNQTTVSFAIKTPYTIESNNKSVAVDMSTMLLPAKFEYRVVPKVDKDVFLLANITNWEQYNLLEGEANIFFEDTFIGKSILDVRYAKDSLQISLGRDKNIVVEREKTKDFTTKKFIGSKKEERRHWNIRIKNNKNQVIKLIVLDQIPVSSREEIKVNLIHASGAKHDTENGEIQWLIALAPNQTKELQLDYRVKYPKQKSLVIE